jgi:hypothetical protein
LQARVRVVGTDAHDAGEIHRHHRRDVGDAEPVAALYVEERQKSWTT